MEKPLEIIRFGELIKEEPVSSLTADLVLPDTFVLEATSPFFGYYNDAPLSEKPPYVYFVLEDCPAMSVVWRASQKVKQNLKHELTADPGTVTLGNTQFPVIRIKNIGKYCRISHVQKLYQKQGIRFRKASRKVYEEMAVIRLNKFLSLHPAGNGLYFDRSEANKGYFRIPVFYSWEAFKELTIQAKYDTGILFFDAAQALYYDEGSITDMVRVYREHLTLEKLSAIRDRYYSVMEQNV